MTCLMYSKWEFFLIKKQKCASLHSVIKSFSLKIKGDNSLRAEHLLCAKQCANNLEYVKIKRHCYSLLEVQIPGEITDHLNLLHPTRQELKFLGFSICFNLLSRSWFDVRTSENIHFSISSLEVFIFVFCSLKTFQSDVQSFLV